MSKSLNLFLLPFLAQRPPILHWHYLHELRQILLPVIQDQLPAFTAGLAHMPGYQHLEASRVVAELIFGQFHGQQILGEFPDLFQTSHYVLVILILDNLLQLHHGRITPNIEVTLFIQYIGDAAAHAGGEVASGAAEHHYDAAGHVFTAVVADTLDDGDGAGVADGEALAGDAPEVALPTRGAVEDGVADDAPCAYMQHEVITDIVFGDDGALGRGRDDDFAAGEALADVVVGLAEEPNGDAVGEEGAEALATGALGINMTGGPPSPLCRSWILPRAGSW